MENSQTIATNLFDVLKTKEEMTLRLKEINASIGAMSVKLNESMADEDIDKISIHGIEFKPIEEQDFSLNSELTNGLSKWDEYPGWFEFLKKIGEEGLIKTKEAVNPQTRKKFLKDYVGDGKLLPEWIKEKFFNTVKWNKSAMAKMVKGDI